MQKDITVCSSYTIWAHNQLEQCMCELCLSLASAEPLYELLYLHCQLQLLFSVPRFTQPLVVDFHGWEEDANVSAASTHWRTRSCRRLGRLRSSFVLSVITTNTERKSLDIFLQRCWWRQQVVWMKKVAMASQVRLCLHLGCIYTISTPPPPTAWTLTWLLWMLPGQLQQWTYQTNRLSPLYSLNAAWTAAPMDVSDE